MQRDPETPETDPAPRRGTPGPGAPPNPRGKPDPAVNPDPDTVPDPVVSDAGDVAVDGQAEPDRGEPDSAG